MAVGPTTTPLDDEISPVTDTIPPSRSVAPVYLLVPDRVSVPVPPLTSEPPVPRRTPLTSVERLLLPTVSWFGPREKVPAPSIEPAVIPPLDREVMSNAPPAVV